MDAKLGLDLLSKGGRLIDPTNGMRRPELGRGRLLVDPLDPGPGPRLWRT